MPSSSLLFNQHICNRHKFHRSASSDIVNYLSHICDRSKKVAKFLSVADMLQIVLADSSQICHRAVVHICSICQFDKGCKHFKDVLEKNPRMGNLNS